MKHNPSAFERRLRTTLAAFLWFAVCLGAALCRNAAAQTWRFIGQTQNEVILEIVASDRTTTYSADSPPSAYVAVPPGARLNCVTPGYATAIAIGEPEPLRDVALARVQIKSGQESKAGGKSEPRRFVFQVVEPDGTKNAKTRLPRATYGFDPEFSFDRLIDAVAINSPVPDDYHRPGLQKGKSGAVRGKWAFPKDCRDAVEVDTPAGTDLLAVRVSDLLKTAGWKVDWLHKRSLKDLCLWNNGERLSFHVSKQPLDGKATLYFRAPKDAAPYYTGSRVYFTLDATDATSAPAFQAPLAGVLGQAVEKARLLARDKMRRIERPGLDVAQCGAAQRGADILMVTIPQFHKPIAPLVEHRRKQGYRVEVVDAGDIYVCFGAGLPNPESIRAFAAHAYENWKPPAPTYLTIVGDASTHFGDNTTSYVLNQVPTHYEGDPQSAPADDHAFACFQGRETFPAMLVGRLTVREPDEARAVARKIIEYETKPEFGPWRARSLWMLDSDYEYLFDPGLAFAPEPLMVRRLEVMDYPFMDHYRIPDTKISPPCNYEMMRSLSDGCLTMHYAGHGGVTLLSKQKVFFHNDVARLSNGTRLPFCTQISCHTGNFDYPDVQYSASIAELMLRRAGGGAIGVFSAGRALYGNEYDMQDGIFRGLYGRPRTTLGLASDEALVRFTMAAGERNRFGDSYNLIGDPATIFTRPPNNLKLSATPDEIEPVIPNTILVTGETSQTRDAKVWVSLIDEKGRQVCGAQTGMKGGRFAAELKTPGGLTVRRLRVTAYAAAPLQEWEGAGTFELRVNPMLLRDEPKSPRPWLALLANSTRVWGRNPVPVDGETVFFEVRAVNYGNAPTGKATLALYHRKKGQPESQRTKVAETAIDPLQALEIRPERVRWDDFNTAGPHIFELCLEGADAQAPKTTGEFRVDIARKSDLLIEDGALKAEWLGRGRVRLQLTVTNNGGSPTGPTASRFYVVDQKGGTEALTPFISTPPVEAGKSIEMPPLTVSLPRGWKPPVNIAARVDVYQDHTELNEDNNAGMARLTTGKP